MQGGAELLAIKDEEGQTAEDIAAAKAKALYAYPAPASVLDTLKA